MADLPELIKKFFPNSENLINVSSHIWQSPRLIRGAGQIGLILSGPSGVGKDTLLELLDPNQFELFKTWTTRQPRGENDTNYTFVSLNQFNQLKADNGFFETNEYAGFMYGTPKSELDRIKRLNKIAIIRIDYHGLVGLRQLQEQGDPVLADWQLINFFVTTNTLESLRQRLFGRSHEDLAVRWKLVEEELSRMSEANYIVVNEQGHQKEIAMEIEQALQNLPRS